MQNELDGIRFQATIDGVLATVTLTGSAITEIGRARGATLSSDAIRAAGVARAQAALTNAGARRGERWNVLVSSGDRVTADKTDPEGSADAGT